MSAVVGLPRGAIIDGFQGSCDLHKLRGVVERSGELRRLASSLFRLFVWRVQQKTGAKLENWAWVFDKRVRELGLRIGSWPGFGDHHNRFLEIYLGGIQNAGGEVTSIKTIEDIPDSGLDVLILHWAEKLFWEASSRWDILIRIYSLIRQLRRIRPETKVIWLTHNVTPHESRRFKRLIWPFYIRALAYSVDAALTLSPGTVPIVQQKIKGLNRKPVSWIWHPAYPRQFEEGTELGGISRDARGWQARHHVFGYCGLIRPYKGVEDLIDVFRCAENPDWRLLIAGRVSSPHFERVLKDKAAADSRILLEFGDMCEREYEAAVLCCDTIVAPFRAYLHSGSLVHALSIGRRILTPATPFAATLSSQVGYGWVELYDGLLSLNDLQKAVQNPTETERPNLSAFDNKRVGEQTLAFINSLS